MSHKNVGEHLMGLDQRKEDQERKMKELDEKMQALEKRGTIGDEFRWEPKASFTNDSVGCANGGMAAIVGKNRHRGET